MKHNIIQTENYLLVGNDNNSKRGWFYCFRTKNVFQDEGEDVLCCNGDMNIIAHLPLNNSPILDGLDLLPPLEDEARTWARSQWSCNPDDYEECYYIGLEKGYNKAKETYKYTEEDVIKIVEKSRKTGLTAEFLLLTFQQPKYPIAFELDFTKLKTNNLGNGFSEFVKPLQTEWVGRYIFD